jgi:hypothetical protein
MAKRKGTKGQMEIWYHIQISVTSTEVQELIVFLTCYVKVNHIQCTYPIAHPFLKVAL